MSAALTSVCPKFVLHPLAQVPCQHCARMTGFYRVAIELPARTEGDGGDAAQMRAATDKLARSWLFGKVFCVN